MTHELQTTGAPVHPLERTRKADKVILPPTYNYAGIFLTFRCPYQCSYCINRFNGSLITRYSEITGREWIRFFERLDTRDVPITLQGGEPGRHPDFIEIVKETSAFHSLDILTNLAFDLSAFVRHIDPALLNREAPYAPIRVSYHPEQFSLQEIVRRVQTLMKAGFRVGLYSVLHPDSLTAVEHAQAVCRDLGIDFRTKPFLGWHKGKLYGDYAYSDAFSGKTRWCECAPSELLVAPDGSIHRCHGFLYSGRRPLGLISEPDLTLEANHLACGKYGQCNPCDIKVKNNRFQQFGHVAMRIRNIAPT